MLRRFIAWNRAVAGRMARWSPALFGVTESYHEDLMVRIQSRLAVAVGQRVLEVGGIDRPLLKKSDSYVYHGIDIEEQETCHQKYDHFLVQSIEDPVPGSYDLIISITLLEHVPDNSASILSMRNALGPGGEMHHYVPSKWHPYSIALRIIGPTLQRKLIPVLRPGAEDVTGYPAFFSHCTVLSMTQLCDEVGFTEIRATPYYRANDYFSFFLPLFILVSLFENLCRILDLRLFCSGFIISANVPYFSPQESKDLNL